MLIFADVVRDSNPLSEGCLVEGAARGNMNMTKSIQVVYNINTHDEIQVKPIS